jgi:hypothetical protein
MAIRANGMDFQSRVPLPGLGRSEHDWRLDYAKILSNGHRSRKLMQYILLDEMVMITKEIVVHSFRQGDVEDPDLYAAEPLYNWQNTPQGEWVMKNAVEPPVWHRMADPANYGHKYIITATFIEKKLTEYYLRFGNDAAKGISM